MILDANKTQIMIEKYFIKRFLSLDGDYRDILFCFTIFLAIQKDKAYPQNLKIAGNFLVDEQHLHNFFPVAQRQICCFDSVEKLSYNCRWLWHWILVM